MRSWAPALQAGCRPGRPHAEAPSLRQASRFAPLLLRYHLEERSSTWRISVSSPRHFAKRSAQSQAAGGFQVEAEARTDSCPPPRESFRRPPARVPGTEQLITTGLPTCGGLDPNFYSTFFLSHDHAVLTICLLFFCPVRQTLLSIIIMSKRPNNELSAHATVPATTPIFYDLKLSVVFHCYRCHYSQHLCA